MRKCLFVLVSIFCFSTLLAQSYEVSWGNEYRQAGILENEFFLVGLTDDAYHMLAHSRAQSTLLSFDWNHNLLESNSVEFNTGKERLHLGSIINTRAGSFTVFNQYDLRTSELRTFTSRFENQSFADVQQIASQSVRFKNSEAATEAIQKINSPLTTSPNGSVVLLTQTNLNRLRTEPEEITINVYDADFNPLWDKAYILDYGENNAEVLHSGISNAGEVYLLVRAWKEFAERRQNAGLPSYSYELLKITSDGAIQKMEISLEKGYAPQYAGLYIPSTSGDDVVVAGMYTDTRRNSNLQGVFSVKVNRDFTQGNTIEQEFSPYFLEDLVSKWANRWDRGLDNEFFIKSFVRFADGKLGFLAEETYSTSLSRTTGASMSLNMQRTYNTNQIVAVIFDPDGQSVLMQKIDKAFDTTSPQRTSFTSALVGNELFLVYHDDKTREERMEIRGSGSAKAFFTDLTVINSNGSISHEQSLFTMPTTDRKSFIPLESRSNEDYLVLLTRSFNAFQVGLLRLPGNVNPTP